MTGAAGMIGRKLTDRLVADGHLGGVGLDRLSLFDAVEPATPEGWTGVVDRVVLDLADPESGDAVVAGRPEVILHLAAVVSGEAEADFDKGYRVNLDGTRHLLEAIRRAHLADGYLPRCVYVLNRGVRRSVARSHPDVFPSTPRTSYGTQKAIDELLLATSPGVGSSMGSSGFRPSASDLASQTQRHPVLLQHPSRAAGRPGGGCRCPSPFGTGTPRRARRSAS